MPRESLAVGRTPMTADVREWRHVFELRALGTTGRPHPSIRRIMADLLRQFAREYSVFFVDLDAKLAG